MAIKNRTLFTGDNLPILRGMDSESVDLIYLDPPFNSNRHYSAPIGSKAHGAKFKDTWVFKDADVAWWGELAESHESLYRVIDATGAAGGDGNRAYLMYMARRLLELHRVLKPTGSIYLHCDPTMSHPLKMAMDVIFGRKNFRNEIIWCYKSGGASKRRFARKHDIILYYAKNDKIGLFNPLKVKSYGQSGGGQGGKVQYLKDKKGTYSIVNARDWWEISMLSTTHGERLGYPTQKPVALLKRIIQASTRELDVVLDPFCGCGTTCIAAEVLNRQWIGIDISPKAARLVLARAEGEIGGLFPVIWRTDIPVDEACN